MNTRLLVVLAAIGTLSGTRQQPMGLLALVAQLLGRAPAPCPATEVEQGLNEPVVISRGTIEPVLFLPARPTGERSDPREDMPSPRLSDRDALGAARTGPQSVSSSPSASKTAPRADRNTRNTEHAAWRWARRPTMEAVRWAGSATGAVCAGNRTRKLRARGRLAVFSVRFNGSGRSPQCLVAPRMP